MVKEFRSDFKDCKIYMSKNQNISQENMNGLDLLFTLSATYYNEYWFNERLILLSKDIYSDNFFSFKRYYMRALCIRSMKEEYMLERILNKEPHGLIMNIRSTLENLRQHKYKVDDNITYRLVEY